MFKIFASRHGPGSSLLVLAAAMLVSLTGFATEYELEGVVKQEMNKSDGRLLHASATFKILVRDCSWLIETMETNELGRVSHWEIGSTNGLETFENGGVLSIILPSGIPVGQTDSAISGHLWLMFASGCYWSTATADRLTPVFDWRASAANHGQNSRVEGGWNLIGGPGSLPSRVWYLGYYGETNANYSITGSQSVGTVAVPTGFVFEQFRQGELTEDTFMHGMVVAKRVEVNVNVIRPVCSRTNLIPSPGASGVIIDYRLNSDVPNRPPSYQNPGADKWLNIEESRALATEGMRKTLSTLKMLEINR